MKMNAFQYLLIIILFGVVLFLPYKSIGQNRMNYKRNYSHPELIKLNKLKEDKSTDYGKKFLVLQKQFLKEKNEENLVNLYELHADFLNDLDAYDSLIVTLHQLRKILKNKPEEESINAYLLLGSTFYGKRNFDSLIFWHKKTTKLIDSQSPHYGRYLLLTGLKYFFEENYKEAIKIELKALKVFEANGDQKHLAKILNNLASNYELLENFNAQQEYLMKAIEINKKLGFTYDLIGNYNNLGVCFKKQNMLEDALKSYLKAFEELQKVNYPMLMAQNFTNRANILEKLGDLYAAEELFLACEKISESNGIAYGVMLSNLNLGNLYRQMEKYAFAKIRLEKALFLSKELNAVREASLIHERISWLYRDQKDFELAYQNLIQYHALSDSLISESVKKEANELKEKYETEKKELEIISLSKDKLNQQFLIALMGIGLLILVILVQWWRNKHLLSEQERKKENELLNIQLELKEKELLADSLKKVSVMHTKEAIYIQIKELIRDLPKTQSSKFSSILNDLRRGHDQSILNEFDARFLGVYESFFDQLKNMAPDLTQTEIRICALMKLNLTTKEIVSLTNRSVGTIDNIRSKIRKKLNLKEDENLQVFLSKLI
jgi:tetratricopeptide (TPR) repeat protein